MAVAALVTLQEYAGRVRDDEVITTASSVAFFTLLAIFPALSAIVALVGLFADPDRIQHLIQTLQSVLPQDSAKLVTDHVEKFAERWSSFRSNPTLWPLLGLFMLFWSANTGTKGLIRALNRIYDIEEGRSFVRFNLVTLGFTLAGIVFLVLAMIGLLLIPWVAQRLSLDGIVPNVVTLLRWPILLVSVVGGLALLYQYGPASPDGPWGSVALGSAVAALLWLIGSLTFSWYVRTFGNFSDTYGSLGTIIGFMVWVWLSATAVLIGAEVDALIREAQIREAQSRRR